MFFLKPVILLMSFGCHSFALDSELENKISANIFGSLTNSSHYNKWLIPNPRNGGPLEVKVRAYVYHLRAKRTTKLALRIQMLLEISWEDPRLSFDEEATKLKIIKGGRRHLRAIWIPPLFSTNEKQIHKIGKISKDDFVTVLPSGMVFLTTRLKTAMFCVLRLEDFPFDKQKCQVSISSWKYSSHLLRLQWDEGMPLRLERLKNGLAEFYVLKVKNISTVDKLSSYKNDDGQEFSSLTIWLQLGRHYGYYFINYYLPSILIVSLSWVSFWLEPSTVTTGRSTIGVSTMLTFISLCWSAQGIQTVSQNTTTDVWAITCTIFIILSLVESAFVNAIDRKGRGEKVEIKKPSSKHIFRVGIDYAAGRALLRRTSSCPSSPPETKRLFISEEKIRSKTIKELREASVALGNLATSIGIEPRKISHHLFAMTPQEIARWIDDKSKFVFPTAFLIFNIFYWLHVIHKASFH